MQQFAVLFISLQSHSTCFGCSCTDMWVLC